MKDFQKYGITILTAIVITIGFVNCATPSPIEQKLAEHTLLSDKEGPTEDLLRAAYLGNVEKVEKALLAGADVNARTKIVIYGLEYTIAEDATSLEIADRFKYEDVAIKILSMKAENISKDKYGITALMYAAKYGLLDIIKLLKSKGVRLDLKNEFHRSALCFAIEGNKLEVIEYLIKNGVPITDYDRFCSSSDESGILG